MDNRRHKTIFWRNKVERLLAGSRARVLRMRRWQDLIFNFTEEIVHERSCGTSNGSAGWFGESAELYGEGVCGLRPEGGDAAIHSSPAHSAGAGRADRDFV